MEYNGEDRKWGTDYWYLFCTSSSYSKDWLLNHLQVLRSQKQKNKNKFFILKDCIKALDPILNKILKFIKNAFFKNNNTTEIEGRQYHTPFALDKWYIYHLWKFQFLISTCLRDFWWTKSHFENRKSDDFDDQKWLH